MTDNAYTRRYLKDPPEKTTKKTEDEQKQKEPVDKSVDDVDKEDS